MSLSFNESKVTVKIKEEEPQFDDANREGAGARLEDLFYKYEEHEVKEEMVLGPEILTSSSATTSMTFKIVQFIEKGRLLLWKVPSSWEDNGKLRYPPCKIDKLRRDPTSIPKDNWKSVNCIVKRSNFSSFQSAESVNKAMSDVSDTEIEIDCAKNFPPLTNQSQYRQMSSHRNQGMNFNDLVFTCIKNQSQMNKPSTVDAEVMITHTAEALPQSTGEQPIQRVSLSQTAGNTSGLTSDQFFYLKSKIEALSTDITNIKNNQGVLCSNQLTMVQKIADISIQFDEFFKRTSQSVRIETPKREVGIVRITDKKSLDDFEESLKNKQTAQELKKTLSVICGQGKGKAINNAYALLDAMFERKFLVGCSWAGGTRAEGNKICFKSYQNTIELFFEVVHMSDKEFTKLECSNFLKGVLRNAKKRYNSQNLRVSHQKKRPSKLKMKQKNPEGKNEPVQHVKEVIELQNLHEERVKENSGADVNEEIHEEENLDLC